MSEAQGDKADYGYAKGEVFHALYGVGVVERNIHYSRDIAGEQGRCYGYIEEYIDDGQGQMGRECSD